MDQAHIPFSHYCFLPYFLPLYLGQTLLLCTFPDLLQKRETSLTVGFVTRNLDLSMTAVTPTHTISNFSGIPNATLYPNCSAGPLYKVRLLNPHALVPRLNLSSPEYTYRRHWSSQFESDRL